MRRSNKGMVGPALLSAGLLLIFIGFFGGWSMPGLSVLEGPDHPMLDVSAYTNIAPGSTQTIRAYLYYHEPLDGVPYHGIPGVPLKVYVGGALMTTITTDAHGRANWQYQAGGPGTYEVKVVFDGDSSYGPAEATVSYTVVESTANQSPEVSESQGSQVPSAASIAMMCAGIALSISGLLITMKRWS